jgi:hypothetical protein
LKKTEIGNRTNSVKSGPDDAHGCSLYDKLIQFGKDCDLGHFPEHSFEVEIHEFLTQELDDAGKMFLAKILPLLIEYHYLDETATVEDVLGFLRRHDSWADMDAFDDLFEETIDSLQKLTPTSTLGDDIKTELLKTLENLRNEINKALDFKSALPIGVGYTGNEPFHRLVQNLAKLAFENSQIFEEYRGR